MPVFAIAGSTFAIGAVVALKSPDFVASDFTTPLTAATVVGEPETLGAISDAWEVEDFTNVTDARTRSIKTVRKGSVVEITCGLDPTDAGQLAMRTAQSLRSNNAFRFTLSDRPATGASPKDSTRLFVGTVLTVEDDLSGKIGKVKFTIQINSNIVPVHASPT
jgi:hypothetical protein